jgi:hypothetical protein
LGRIGEHPEPAQKKQREAQDDCGKVEMFDGCVHKNIRILLSDNEIAA